MILSVDDASASDVRVADLASKYEIETVFYWPVEWHSLAYVKGYDPLNYADAYQIAQEFEIGSHTITHPHLTRIAEEEAIYEIVASRTLLGQMFNKSIKKFCPPRGYTNGVLTDVTLLVYESQRLTKGPGLVHIHPNSGANGNIHWLEYARNNEITEAWGHSYEFDKFDMWGEIEDWMRELATHGK